MRYLIHACPAREWFVEGYMVPEMKRQGIPEEEIEIWMDRNGDGNLISCMKSFEECGKRDGGTWHLQDDVVLASDFAEKTRTHDDGLVCGFGRIGWQQLEPMPGKVSAVFMWNSFQCIRIPDEIAGECAKWFYEDAAFRDIYRRNVEENKYDDSFFYDFICEAHMDMTVLNLVPSIVDHGDCLTGGSVINGDRTIWARSSWWEDDEAFRRAQDIVKELRPDG